VACAFSGILASRGAWVPGVPVCTGVLLAMVYCCSVLLANVKIKLYSLYTAYCILVVVLRGSASGD
jgi:hypothetical protein